LRRKGGETIQGNEDYGPKSAEGRKTDSFQNLEKKMSRGGWGKKKRKKTQQKSKRKQGVDQERATYSGGKTKRTASTTRKVGAGGREVGAEKKSGSRGESFEVADWESVLGS